MSLRRDLGSHLPGDAIVGVDVDAACAGRAGTSSTRFLTRASRPLKFSLKFVRWLVVPMYRTRPFMVKWGMDVLWKRNCSLGNSVRVGAYRV